MTKPDTNLRTPALKRKGANEVATTHPSSIADILEKLHNLESSKDGEWQADCPVPIHKTPAKHLSVKDGGDKAVLCCHPTNHEYKDFCSALGYDTLAYGDGNCNEHSGPVKLADSYIAATYDYHDEKGNLLFQVVRFEPKDFRQRRPGTKPGEWLYDLKGVRRVLYHRDEIQKAIAQKETIWCPEGEKDADSLWDVALVGTTSPMGAGKGKWLPEYTAQLKGAKLVVILPDADKPGAEFAAEKASALCAAGIPVKVLPPFGTGKVEAGGNGIHDVSDWLANGHTADELLAIADALPEWTDTKYENSVICLAHVVPQKVEWLHKPFIPRGKLSIMEGDPGTGKTHVSNAWATSVSQGTMGFPKGNVLLMSAEDGLADTIVPRLIQLGADRTRIFAPKELFSLNDAGIQTLEGLICYVKPILVVLDPIVAYIDTDIDINKANQVRHITAQLARIAESYNCSVLGLRHLTKSGSSKAIYRGSGSIDFTGAARSVILAGLDSETGERALVHIKCNLAPLGKSIGYKLTDDGLQWTGDSEMTAQRIFADEGSSQMDNATALLERILAEGEIESSNIYTQADKQGISMATLKRAVKALKVVSRREGGGKDQQWYMSLPAEKNL